MTPKVSINLVNYNTKEMLRYSLRKIREADISVPHEVVVLDNASKDTDEVMEMVKEEYPEAVRIQEPTNTGYTKGVNTCAKNSRAEYVFNMNPDVIVEAGQLEKLASYLDEHSEVGLVGPKLLNFDGTVQGSCFQFLTPQMALYRRTPLGRLPFAKQRINEFLLNDGWDWNSIREVDWILGAAVMYRRSVAEQLGHLDEDMFLYLSDTDFAWKLWKNKYKVVYYPEAVLHHYYRKSSDGGFNPLKLRNFAYRSHIKDGMTFFRKHFGEGNPRLKYHKTQ